MDGFTVKNSEKFLNTGDLRIGHQHQIENLHRGDGSDGMSGLSFENTLKEAIGQVNQLQRASDKSMQDLATGRTDNVADVMIAAEKADIALRTMVQVRNKIIDAYQEIMKMQV